jgi:hypothetical protein
MATRPQLQKKAVKAYDELEEARGAYRTAARRYLIAELLKILGETPQVVAFQLSAEYEYDDEGGYLRCLSGSVTFADDAAEATEDFDDCWTEGLDVEQAVVLELFGIEDLGEAALTREQLCALAAEEKVSCPA